MIRDGTFRSKILQLSEVEGKTAAQVLLRWGLQMDFQVIPKYLGKQGRRSTYAQKQKCCQGVFVKSVCRRTCHSAARPPILQASSVGILIA